MTLRRIPALVVVVGALVALVVLARGRPESAPPVFGNAAAGWMPAAPVPGALTESWFCPGAPATGVDGVASTIVVVNRAGQPMAGTALLYNERGENRRLAIEIGPWSTSTVDLTATLPGAMVAAVIEVDGGGALVEQHALDPAGNSYVACANATSDTWYFADGFTVEGSLNQIVLSNPYDQTVVAQLQFATQEGSRAPGSYSNLPVAARSTRVIDLGAPGAGAQGEPVLAVSVTTTKGRLVVGRSQRFVGGGRGGTQVSLAAPEAREQWYFANGLKSPGVTERYALYNPTDDDIEITPVIVGVAGLAVDPIPIPVPKKEVVTFDPASVAGLPDGRYAIVFATLSTPALVVERATTQTTNDETATAVNLGSPTRQDGYLARVWHVPVAPSEPAAAALVVYNADASPGTVTVSAVGSSGPVPVPGLENIVIPAAGVVTIDLVDPIVVGRALIIESTSRVFVERAFPNGRGDLRNISWAVPAAS